MRRTATIVFDVISVRRSPQEMTASVLGLVDDVLEQRTQSLREEAQTIVSEASQAIDIGTGHPRLRTARWYRICSQLDILNPLRIAIAAIVDSNASYERRFSGIRDHIEVQMKDLMAQSCNEAQTIANDMEALALRIQSRGQLAEMCDIKSAQWYSTVSQVQALVVIYRAACEIMQLPQRTVLPCLETDGLNETTETDSPIAD